MGDGLLHGEEVDDDGEGGEGQAHETDEPGHQQQRPLHRHRGEDEQPGHQGQHRQDVVLPPTNIRISCGGSESDKSQERTDLLSEGTGLIFRAGKL